MGAALALSERGRGRTHPNPCVGCVLVGDGRVVGRGWTQPSGRPHAEAMAVSQAGEKSRGATAYVTLEPCAAPGRGPACADVLIDAGVARVVAALRDPFPAVDGKGFAKLEAAGIAVDIGSGAVAAERAMSGFLIRQRLGRPHVALKLALSIDGAVAMGSGASRWITGDAARAHGHLMRARSDAILVGRGTFDADAPRLDVRLPGLEDRSPRRFVLSSREGVPDGWTYLARPDAIGTMDANWLLIEGGMGTAAAFLSRDLVDTLLVYRAPIIVGGGRMLGDIGLTDLSDAHGQWMLADSRRLGSDRLDVYERTR